MKSYDIMDVNTQAVESVITPVDYLIHGHTHRPDIHHVLNKQRIVLGDWRERTNEAVILEIAFHRKPKIIHWNIP
jgi:UDP-2,3-diacylglucosamine hydrolase